MLVIGNGLSRSKIDLNKIYQEKIGCNAVFRDCYIDHLVCCDKRMVKQAMGHGHPSIYTRPRWADDFNHEPVQHLPNLVEEGSDRKDDPFHWGSGPYAILLGAFMDANIQMVGFDLYGVDKKINNVYSDTEGYKSSDNSATDHSYWVYQIAKVFTWFPQTTFRIYNTPEWDMPKEWKLANVSLDTLDKL